jgi:hypothetical protein
MGRAVLRVDGLLLSCGHQEKSPEGRVGHRRRHAMAPADAPLP